MLLDFSKISGLLSLLEEIDLNKVPAIQAAVAAYRDLPDTTTAADRIRAATDVLSAIAAATKTAADDEIVDVIQSLEHTQVFTWFVDLVGHTTARLAGQPHLVGAGRGGFPHPEAMPSRDEQDLAQRIADCLAGRGEFAQAPAAAESATAGDVTPPAPPAPTPVPLPHSIIDRLSNINWQQIIQLAQTIASLIALFK